LTQQVSQIHQAAVARHDHHQPAAEAVEALPEYKTFFAAIGHDLDTSTALTQVWQVLKSSILSPQEQYRLLLEFDQVLGLGLAKISADSASDLAITNQPIDLETLAPDLMLELEFC
jgi:hypothetical protein